MLKTKRPITVLLLFSAIFLGLLVLSSLAFGAYDHHLDVNLRRTRAYELLNVDTPRGMDIYYANDDTCHFLFITTETSWQGNLLVRSTGKPESEENLGYNPSRLEVAALVVSDKAEIRLDMETWGGDIELFLQGKWYRLVLHPAQPQITSASVLYSGWAFGITASVLVIAYDRSKAFLGKKYIKVWEELTPKKIEAKEAKDELSSRQKALIQSKSKDKKTQRIFSEKPESLGEFKNSNFDHSRAAFRFEFRNYITGKSSFVFSPFSLDTLIEKCQYVEYFPFYHVLHCTLARRNLPEPVRLEGDYSFAWKLYMRFFMFPISLLINPLLIMLPIVLVDSMAVIPSFIAGLVVFLITLTLFLLTQHGYIVPRRTVEYILYEKWLYPVESPLKRVPLYKVEYDREVQKTKSDEASQMEIEPIKDTIEGDEALYRLKSDARVKNLKKDEAGYTEQYTPLLESMALNRDHFSRSSSLWNQLITLRIDLMRANAEIRDLHEQLSYEQATKHSEISEALSVAYKQAEEKALTLKKLMERQFGSTLVNKSFESTLNDLLDELHTSEMTSRLYRLDVLTNKLGEIIVRLGVQTRDKNEIDIGEFEEYLKSIGENGGADAGGSRPAAESTGM